MCLIIVFVVVIYLLLFIYLLNKRQLHALCGKKVLNILERKIKQKRT